MACEPTIITKQGPLGRSEDTDAILMCSEHGEVGRINGINYDVRREMWEPPHPITERVLSAKWNEHIAAQREPDAVGQLPVHLL